MLWLTWNHPIGGAAELPEVQPLVRFRFRLRDVNGGSGLSDRIAAARAASRVPPAGAVLLPQGFGDDPDRPLWQRGSEAAWREAALAICETWWSLYQLAPRAVIFDHESLSPGLYIGESSAERRRRREQLMAKVAYRTIRDQWHSCHVGNYGGWHFGSLDCPAMYRPYDLERMRNNLTTSSSGADGSALRPCWPWVLVPGFRMRNGAVSTSDDLLLTAALARQMRQSQVVIAWDDKDTTTEAHWNAFAGAVKAMAVAERSAG